MLTRWRSATEDKTPDWFRKNISEYAPKTVYEEIAETFTLMTMPDYQRGSLPKEIESVIDIMLGVGGK